jgi:hypothetical protein
MSLQIDEGSLTARCEGGDHLLLNLVITNLDGFGERDEGGRGVFVSVALGKSCCIWTKL